MGLSLLPTLGMATGKSTSCCGSLDSAQEKSGQGSDGHASTPGGVLELSVPPSTVQILGPKSQLESCCWLLIPSTEAEPRCFLLSQEWS